MPSPEAQGFIVRHPTNVEALRILYTQGAQPLRTILCVETHEPDEPTLTTIRPALIENIGQASDALDAMREADALIISDPPFPESDGSSIHAVMLRHPDETEREAIIKAQGLEPKREIVCFREGRPRGRKPNTDVKNGNAHNLFDLYYDMGGADAVLIHEDESR